MRELVARVHALLRRVERAGAGRPTSAGPPVVVGDLEIDRAERRVRPGRRRGAPDADRVRPAASTWPPRRGAVLPRERLLADVWGWADAPGTRTVDSHVKALRRKLGADLVRTVHGVGYALEEPR